MKRKDEIAYFDKLWRKMRKNLKTYLKTEAANDLHSFRVQVKKLRAFITLAESEGKPGQLKQTFKPVKKLFSKAGEIRNADLHIESARKDTGNEPFIRQQNKLRKKALKTFRPMINKKLHKLSSIKRRLHKKIKPVSNVHINLFYQENLKQVDDNLQNIRFDESLHTARKQLKVLLYNHQLTEPVLNVGFNTEYVDRIQERIGDWHDNEDAKAFFQNDDSALAGIQRKEELLKMRVQEVVEDLYNRATTVNEAVPQNS